MGMNAMIPIILKRINRYISFLVVLISLVSCQPSTHFEETVEFDHNNWVKFNDLNFNIPVEAGKTYSFNGSITVDSTYTRRKLEMGFYLYLPDDAQRLEDKTIRIRDFEYQPLGHKTDKGYVLKQNFKQKLRINESGILKLKMVLHSSHLNNYGIKKLKIIVIED